MTVTITLTVAGSDTGPFDLYSNVDGFTVPFATSVSKAALLAGYTTGAVPNGTTTIRVKSMSVCTNYTDLIVTTTTTTTSSTTSTTTTLPCYECYEYTYGPAFSGCTIYWVDCFGVTQSTFVAFGATYTVACMRESSGTGCGPWTKGALCGSYGPGCSTTTTTTTVPTPYAYGNSGRSNTNEGDACSDAIANTRTFYSNCDPGTFGTGCVVYLDLGLTTPLTGYAYVFMNGANYDLNPLTGEVLGLSAIQC